MTEPNKTRGVAARAGEYFCKLSEFYAPIYIAAPSRAARLRFFQKLSPFIFYGLERAAANKSIHAGKNDE